MLDVEFLLSPPPMPRCIIYRYRSGILRSSVKRMVQRSMANGHSFRHLNEDEPYEALSSLFPAMYVCDLASVKQSFARELRAWLDYFFAMSGNSLFLLVPDVAWTSDWPDASDIAQLGLFIEEPQDITGAALGSVLEYLFATTDLPQANAISNKGAFQKSFDDFSVSGSEALPELIKEFERRVLLHVDPETHRFDEHWFTGDEYVRKRSSPSRHLTRLLSQQRRQDLAKLVQHFDQRSLGKRHTSNSLIADLYRISGNLLDQAASVTDNVFGSGRRVPTGEKRRVLRLQDCLLWSSLLLAWETRLTDYNFSLSIHQLGEEYLTRVSNEASAKGPHGLWSELTAGLSKVALPNDRLSHSRSRITRSLITNLKAPSCVADPPWMMELRRILESLNISDSAVIGGTRS